MTYNSSKNYQEKLLKALKEVKADGTADDYHRSLTRVIQRWEQESIDDIHQFANETRDHIDRTIQIRCDRIDKNLQDLKQMFLEARQHREIYDQNSIKWLKQLQQLQNILNDQVSQPLTSTDTSMNELLELDEDSWDEYPEDQEPSEFYTGKFIRRFKLDDYDDRFFLVFGIISGQTSKTFKSYKNPTFYGWTKDDLVYVAGVPESRYQNYRSDHQNSGNFIQLILDCDQHQITYFNEKHQTTYRLSINPKKCPFPWILCIYFQSFND